MMLFSYFGPQVGRVDPESVHPACLGQVMMFSALASHLDHLMLSFGKKSFLCQAPILS